MRLALTVAAVLLAIPGAAAAQASLRVQPLIVSVDAPSQASSISIENTGSSPLSLQIRVFEWSQPGGQDVLAPTTDVVVSPPAATIPPGASYTVRVARTAGAAESGEKSYRLWIDELPPAGPPRPGGGEVAVRLRYDLPVFFHARDAASNVAWRAYRSGEGLVLEATNSGTRHARIEGLKVIAAGSEISFGDGLNGYVLAGTTRRWTGPAGAAPPATNSGVTVVTGAGDGEMRQPITIASN